MNANAMAVHGVPRATGDLDVWIEVGRENAGLVWQALERFGAPTEALGVSREDLATPGTVIQIGLPPRRIDLITQATGLDFDEAWADRSVQRVGELEVPFLGLGSLIRNKRATGRTKDRADLELLERDEEA